MTLVVDASVACKWLVEEVGSAEAAKLLAGNEGLIAPDLVIPEVCNALWSKSRAGQIAAAVARELVDGIAGFFDALVPSARLAARSFAIAETLDHPVCDCFYLALAEHADAPLVTADARLLNRLAATTWAQRAISIHDAGGAG
jgi:predicted nucleic acid-binding protein